MRILIIFIFLLTNSFANEATDIKNLVINKELKKYDSLTFLDAKNTQFDLKNYKGSPAYSLWKKEISKIAQVVGYKFLDFLGAEDSIQSSKDEKLGVPTGLMEDFNVPINIGDTVMMGKFKNKPVVVQTIQWSQKGDLLINGKPISSIDYAKKYVKYYSFNFIKNVQIR